MDETISNSPPSLPPPPKPSKPATWMIVLVVVIVLCCCVFGAIGLFIAFGEDLLYELGLSALLPFQALIS